MDYPLVRYYFLDVVVKILESSTLGNRSQVILVIDKL